jgi:hypothetical protein
VQFKKYNQLNHTYEFHLISVSQEQLNKRTEVSQENSIAHNIGEVMATASISWDLALRKKRQLIN